MAHFDDIDEASEASYDPLSTHITDSAEEELDNDDLLTERCRRAVDGIAWCKLNNDMDFESENLYC